MSARRAAALAPAILTTLALTGCSAPESSTDRSTAAPGLAGSEVEAGETAAGAGGDPAGGATCLHGVWVADNDHLLTRFEEFGDEVGSVEGRVTVEFAPDGTTRTTYDDWRVEALVDGRRSTIRRDGVDAGTYQARDQSISLRDTKVGTTMSLSVGGHRMAVPVDPVDYADAAYTCSASEAVITTADGPLRLVRE